MAEENLGPAAGLDKKAAKKAEKARRKEEKRNRKLAKRKRRKTVRQMSSKKNPWWRQGGSRFCYTDDYCHLDCYFSSSDTF